MPIPHLNIITIGKGKNALARAVMIHARRQEAAERVHRVVGANTKDVCKTHQREREEDLPIYSPGTRLQSRIVKLVRKTWATVLKSVPPRPTNYFSNRSDFSRYSYKVYKSSFLETENPNLTQLSRLQEAKQLSLSFLSFELRNAIHSQAFSPSSRV